MNEPKLTAKRVNELYASSLFDDGEDISRRVETEGIMNRTGFHPKRIKAHEEEIRSLLMELPDEFLQSKGGGMSFLNACMDRHGNHWAEHPTMDKLFQLGMAIGAVKCLLPREKWKMLPAGMPYYTVLDVEEAPCDSRAC